ncbi:MAG TPA: chemotaxis protein CheW [Gemmataceae bacterium]|nr:chemotaxis protein CheW [Gemmataceae bacterium]
MESQASDSGESSSVWERLRETLAKLRASAGRKSDPEARARRLLDRAQQVRRQIGSVEPTSAPFYFLAFSKGRKRYGLPLECVLEALPLEQFSPVPGAPAWVRGVVHWRGAVLALLDLTRLFEIAEVGLSDLHAYIVVEARGKRLALAASVVDDILAAPRAQLRIAPEIDQKIDPEWLLGVHNEERLILNLDAIFKFLEQRGAT